MDQAQVLPPGGGAEASTRSTAPADAAPRITPPAIPTIPPLATQSMLPTVIHLPPRRTLIPWLVAAGILALAFVFRHALTLGFVGFSVAYVLSPIVRRAERLRIPRPVTILLVMLSGTALVVASAWVLIPEMLRQSESLARSVPRYSQYIQREWIPYLRNRWHLHIPPRTEDALAQLGLRASSIAPRIGALLNNTLQYTLVLVELLFNALIVFALAFYFLLDFDGVVQRAFDLVPHRARDRVGRLGREINETLRHFINGQLLVMAILALLFALGLGVLGVPAWWAIGLFAGMISFVPYLGFFVALGLAIFMAALQGQGIAHVLAVCGVMTMVHVLDLTLITPRILGGRAKISPVVVILALVAGGSIFGFVGVLVAIPVASVLRVLLREVVSYYKTTPYFLSRPISIASLQGITPLATIPTALQTDLSSVVIAPAVISQSAIGSSPPDGVAPATPISGKDPTPGSAALTSTPPGGTS